jgi:hypothetical protein
VQITGLGQANVESATLPTAPFPEGVIVTVDVACWPRFTVLGENGVSVKM